MAYVRQFILDTTENYYNKTKLQLNNTSEEALSDFINNSQSLLLQSVLHTDQLVLIYNKLQDDKKNSIVFYKTAAQDLNGADALNNIHIITLSDSAAASLYTILRQIYSPLLISGNDLYSNKLQKNLSDLEYNLRILTHGKGTDNINVILTIEDELDYWKLIAEKKDANKKQREAAAAFRDLFQDIAEEIRTMQSSSLSEVRESAENIGGLLDDVWRLTAVPYARDRMIHVFDIIAHSICSMIQKLFSTLDLWSVKSEIKESELLVLLSDSLQVVHTWTSACSSLTQTYWPNYALHTWDKEPYVPPFCVNFQNRLKEIYDIRSTFCQLNKLLTSNEKTELQTDLLFKPFESVNVWMCNGVNTAWDAAVSKFSGSLRPAEAKIAEKLRPRLHNTSTKQMLYEFMRYRALIERPLVKHALNNELEIFVSSLLSMLKGIQEQLDADEVDVRMYQPPDMSPLVQRVQWAKQTEAKVKEIQTCAEKYLSEFQGSSELSELATQVAKDLKTMYMQLYEEWCRDLQAQAQNGSLQLSLDKPVVEFSAGSQLMVVNFNPRLVSVQSQAQALAALGLPPPACAATLHSLGDTLTHARQLQQVASFHNTLGERMVPSTRPLMLQAALGLSSLVRDHHAVYWQHAQQLADYTDKLKALVLKLEAQNSYLTSQHLAIRSIVEQLMDTELLAKQSDWKKRVKDIRDIIETVENKGYKNTELWKSHWDWQLYKALECQYIKTLLSLHKHFPHVKVDLVLRNHAVRVQPPIEEIRVQHYHQLRRLVSMPAHFVGIQNNLDQKSIFTAIVDKHSWLGNKAVQQIEAAMCALESTCKTWTRRAALACVPDVGALCTQHLKEPHDWEINFKACKAYGQAVAKMTFEEEKIEWISVGTAALRREMEAQARALWGGLLGALQASCRDDQARLDAFVASAALLAHNKGMPRTARELTDLSAAHHALQHNMPEMEKLVEDLKRKGHMLRTWGGDSSVSGTIKEWQKIRELMVSQQQMFEHQAEIVKSSLAGDWENLNSSVEAWVSRWVQARPRLEDARGLPRAEMADRCRSVFDAHDLWLKLVADRDELLKECEKFNMAFEVSDTWKQAEKLIMEYVNLWTILKEYNEEFEMLAQQEWIVFQKKLHLLDEFVSKWKGKLEPYTSVTLFIQQEIDKYSDLTILLKYLRGTDFTERHWREVYGLLEMEYKKPETLIVNDLLSVASNIKKNFKALQKICLVASSESAIRSALNELEIWFAGARFTMTYNNDKTKRPTPIVKDFKDLLTKIEEQQWVVSSVSGGGGEDACAAWESRLRAARTLVKATHHAQRRWLYLEPILSNDEGDLGLKFRKVDQGFKQVTRILESDPRLSALLQTSRLQPMLDSISEQLLSCQSALNQYIDEKRSVFPRLYFLSDDDLLELLGQARAGADGREVVMQTHLKKLFPGTTGVRLGPGQLSITALCTHYGETFQLDHPVDIDCPVEVWLKNLETEMRSSLTNMTLKCVVNSSLNEQDTFSLPTQILCLAQNIRFTEQAEKAIMSKELHKLKSSLEKEYSHYTAAELEDESERHKRQALILQCAHYMSVIKTLIDSNVVATTDWLWQKQLRFYLLNKKEVVARMGLAQISYSYEYLGANTGQFVRTELADECFLILTQSLHLGLVGNPFGPAGTGKTESVKALGGLVGRLVLVFNCDEAMDAESMGRLLSGLALCGAWGCFDEFNRLTADTLATVSHQFASLLASTHQRNSGSAATALLNGKQVRLSVWCGVVATMSPAGCVLETFLTSHFKVRVSVWCGVAATMNPAGRGYGGRRALPAALGRVLRPVALAAPPPRLLAHRLLASRPTPHAQLIADDLHNVFLLASALLSRQGHYDWGMRALKAAVGSCGAALAQRPATSAPLPLRAAARRVLALNNVSKLTTQDAHRFECILSLVFADVPAEESKSDPINSALDIALKNLKLVHNERQIQKCVELFEQLQQRMGVVIVGPPGSGKSTIRRLLKTALTHQGKNIVEYTICPKAMSRDWLLGNIDHDTRQWTDGVISATALEISNQPADVWSWVVCDGDIDPEWIEALNSVLDDNRLLTLPSGWRIQFGSNVNFIFETHTMEHASPATVSRMGVILLSEDITCDQEVLECWMQKVEFENETVRMALPLLQQAIKKCTHWLAGHKADVIMKLYSISMVRQIITQFEYISTNVGVNATRTSPEEIVYLALERSVIGNIKEQAVDGFHDEMCELLGPPPSAPTPTTEWVSDTLYMSARLANCEPAVRAYVASEQSHLILIGPDACAKNCLAEYVLKECNSTVITIDCTPILEPSDIIMELQRNNAVRSGGGGVGGHTARVTLLVRALHRARVDAWGSSPVHSFLLQLIEHGGFWSRGGEGGGEGVQWRGVVCVRVVATAHMHAPLAPRLHAALAPVALTEPDDDELLEVATTSLKNSVDKSIPLKDLATIAGSILMMFKEVTEAFDSRPHYKWNSSHLRKWCENMKWYSPSNTEQLLMALSAEANFMFKERLVMNGEKAQFAVVSRKYLKGSVVDSMYFICKLRGDGVYMESLDYDEWYQRTQRLINQCLSEYDNNVFGDTGVEVSSELAVLCPVMARATNGCVCVALGSAGAGRRAAARLSAALLPATLLALHHPEQFYTHFKNALASAGEGTKTLIVMSESAVTDTSLSSIEALIRAHSLQAIPTLMMPSTQPQHMLRNIKQNLGIAICLDKNSEDLSNLMEKHPLLYNEGHVVWIDEWSERSLREVPPLIVERLLKETVTESKEHLETLPVEGFVNIYKNLDIEWKRAPCRYVNFVKTYYYVVSSKKTALDHRRTMLTAGVEALRRARIEVSTLQKEAIEQESALSEEQTKGNLALDQISATVRATTDKKDEMHALKHNIQIENEKLQIQKKEIEAELASVEPVIAAARSAVGDIRPESLSEVRSLRAPPEVVRDVLEGVLRLMGIADTSWHSMKNFLSKRGVKEDIRCLDASQISPAALQGVQTLLEKRGSSFEPSVARRASAACAPLAAWVRANLDYAAALQRVQPLQAQQDALHRNLAAAESQLSSLSSGLSSVEERVVSLRAQLGQHARDAAALELRVATAHQTLRAADRLLTQLATEYTAWEHDLEYISKEIEELNQRSLLAAAYVVYLPDLTEPQAREYLSKWSSLIGFDDASFSVINFLSTSEKQLRWDAEGLPSDKTAIKNAVLVDEIFQMNKCGLTPFIVDPDGEGLAWLKTTLANANCDFVSQDSDKLATAVQYATRLGRVLVVTDVECVHELVAPLVANGGRLLLHSRSVTAISRLPPHFAARLSPLYFTARLDGLTDQLVHYALQQQNPELDEKVKEIKLKKATLQKQQHELQENLLEDLARSVDILHDTALQTSLEKTRVTSETIAEAVEAARGVSARCTTYCETHERSARRVAALALAVKELTVRWPLLALPVDAVLDVYVDALRKVTNQGDINNENVVKYATRRIVERVLLSLHKKDKYIVVLHLLKEVYDDIMPGKLWRVFIGSYDLSEDKDCVNYIKKNHSWVPEECIKKLAKLKVASEDLFKRLSLHNEELWNQFLSSGDMNVIDKLMLEAFETVVAVASIRPDSLYRVIVAFVDQVLGGGVMCGGASLVVASRGAARGAWGGPPRPVLLLAAHAADVLHAHAHAHTLTMVGVEEGRSAWESALSSARGGWLALVVGASPFTPQLRAFLAHYLDLPAEDFSDDFRLWIVSEDRDIPSVISNACVNVILEAPEGVKNNVLGTLGAWGAGAGGALANDARTARLLAALALFHALVQERRAYIPHGWSRWYGWEWGEVMAGAAAVRGGAGAWLVGALYAARVPAASDRRALAALQRRTLATHTPPALPHPLPAATTRQAYAAAFDALPSIDTPELLGLPENCRVAWERSSATNILSGLLELNSTVSANHKNNSAPLKTVLALWKKYMAGSPLIKGEYQATQAMEGWWGCVCACELEAAARAATALHRRLGLLARAPFPCALHKVPEEWQVLWSGPEAPDVYIKEFCYRARSALTRLETFDSSPDYMPTEVDLRSFLEPSRAVWSLRARTAARLNCSLHALRLHLYWDARTEEVGAGCGLVVNGMMLCGAECGGGAVRAAGVGSPPHSPAPPLLLRYLPVERPLVEPSEGGAWVPVYSDASREQLVCEARASLPRHFPADTAALHALALYIAPYN